MKCAIILGLFLLGFSIISFAQPKKKDFVIEITFVDWLYQPFIKYTLNKKSVKIETSNYDDFKIINKVLYKRRISKLAGDSIYTILSKMKIDTAKANCNNPVLDGLYTTYYFEGYGLGQTLIKTHACIKGSAAKLQKLVENQIKKKKYRYWNLKIHE